MNKKILIVSLIVFLCLSVAIYQYAEELQSEFTSAAYTTSKPANGHLWSEMECTSDLCVKAGVGVGVGIEPTVKFEVNGTIKGTDVCNAAGNCLSALSNLTNACGGAATNYVYSASAYSGTYCSMGTSTPATPTFPVAGASVTWTCPVTNSSPISCTATHAAAPVAGVCGAAATTYAYSATAYSGALCSTGASSPAAPAFPAQGASINWSCLGTNGGSSPSCTASRNNPPAANGVCGAAATTYGYPATAYSGALCSVGDASPASPSFPAVGNSVSWSCLGTNGGSSPSCTASRSNPAPLLGGSGRTEADCISAGGTVVASDVTYNQCRFSGASCPSGWTHYQNYSATTSSTCSICTSATTGSHTWANSPSETATYQQYSNNGICGGGPYCNTALWNCPLTCTASITQIGCY
jgi:hypothetical protein